MGTCSETISKHRILFPSIQHLAWFPQGRPQGKQKCGKNSDFWTYALTKASYNWETIKYRWVHAARGLASTELSFHPCNILRDNRRGVSRGNKNVGCSTWKGRFFSPVVRKTGKLLKIDRYMLRGVWQALKCLFIHATFCVIATWASPGQTKNEGRAPGYVKMTIFCSCGSNSNN